MCAHVQANVKETQALLQSFATNLMMDRKAVKSYTVSISCVYVRVYIYTCAHVRITDA